MLRFADVFSLVAFMFPAHSAASGPMWAWRPRPRLQDLRELSPYLQRDLGLIDADHRTRYLR